MRKTILKPLLVLSLLLATVACSPQVAATATPNSAGTSVAQTLVALTPTSQPGIPITGGESPTPTLTAAVPTVPPTLALSPTPIVTSIPATSTTPALAQVSVSLGTNCRTGPGISFERVGALPAGQVAQVVGRNAAGNYWIIMNPDRPGETCWLWGQFATVTGNTAALPVLTLPTTPTSMAGFDVAYKGIIENCTNVGWWTEIRLQNTGGLTFKSMTLVVQDSDTNTSQTLYSDGFIDKNGCNGSTTQSTLTTGESATVSSPIFGYDLTGHRLKATITLCSDLKQAGTCVSQTVTLKP